MTVYGLTQDRFHYDNSGYYGYILFSGKNAELHALLGALGRGDKEHGFGWHRWGRSFRPADNGIVYDYYIRLRGKGDTKPSAAAVGDFLRREIQPPKEPADATPTQEPGVATIDSADPPPWAKQLQKKVEALNENTLRLGEDLPTLNNKFDQLQESFAPLNTSITRLSEDLAESQLAAERTKDELAAKENELKELKTELALAKEQLAENSNGSNAGVNQAIKQLEDELKKVEAKKQEIEQGYKKQNDILKKDRNYWQNSYHEKAQELSRLEKRNQENTRDNIKGKDGSINKRDFENILEGISPNLVFVRGSLDTLYQEVDDYRFVFQRLCAIVYDPKYNGRNAFKGTKRSGGISKGSNAHIKWREDRVGNNRWRIYFCKDSKAVGDKFVVLISEKSDQKSDERWVVNNDPSTLI